MSVTFREINPGMLQGLDAGFADKVRNAAEDFGDRAGKAANAAAGAAGDPLAALLAGGRLTVSSAFSPAVTIRIEDLLAPRPKPTSPSKGADWYAKMAQPTFVLESPTLGRQVIAPGGIADPGSWKKYAAIVALGAAGLGFAIFMLGRWSK